MIAKLTGKYGAISHLFPNGIPLLQRGEYKDFDTETNQFTKTHISWSVDTKALNDEQFEGLASVLAPSIPTTEIKRLQGGFLIREDSLQFDG